ncbi:hypothetical protein AALP_AA3G334000 [Arabis alpina]|uniref:DUF4283 domain-containing protein n=1 Tax=Arabis alpina TaxID=50452 RepID=A0A087HDC6_ARAAL|nr:hypothetical protein AALP_AA3G334000 [Arabis alpina]
MESQKAIWEDLKDLRLGSDGEPWVVHEDVQAKYIREHKLCLVAKGLNSDHQNPAGIKKAMPGKWGLIGKVEGQVTDKGLVKFYFQKEHQLLTVLDRAPYEYRGWMVAVDLWNRRNSLTFLRIYINKLPQEYRRFDLVHNIGSKLGHVVDKCIIEPNLLHDRPAKVWVQVEFDIDNVITKTRNVTIIQGEPLVDLEFTYQGLEKYCAICGSLRHAYDKCPKASTLTTMAGTLMEISHDPYATANERRVAIEGINSGQ